MNSMVRPMATNPGAITKISVIFNVENYTHKVELAN